MTLAIKDELDELVPDLGLDSKQLNGICEKYFQKKTLRKVFYLFEFTQKYQLTFSNLYHLVSTENLSRNIHGCMM